MQIASSGEENSTKGTVAVVAVKPDTDVIRTEISKRIMLLVSWIEYHNFPKSV